VNLDNYRVRILRHPTTRGLDSTKGLLKYIRLNINQFLDPNKCAFAPYSDGDKARWNSDLPVGAVMHIDLGGTGVSNPEDGSVVCSAHSDTHWTFSTIWTRADFNHPVSGNRQFGCFTISGPGVPNDGAYIYTRAADRITPNIVNSFLMDKIFKGGHETWLGFQQRVVHFVAMKGGTAETLAPFSARHAWSKMQEQHKPTTEWVVKSRHYFPPHKTTDGELSTRGGPI
jgi:hypothetical protein